MNLWLRALWLFLRLPFLKRHTGPDAWRQESRLAMRVWPPDCDFNLHMNNGRYLTAMDLGRVHLVALSGLLTLTLRQRWMPVLAAAEIAFLRPLPPLARYTLVTRLVSWDEKYFYIEQRFERHGHLHAHAFVKGCFLQKHRRVPITEIMQLAGWQADVAPPMPEALRVWAQLSVLKKDTVR